MKRIFLMMAVAFMAMTPLAGNAAKSVNSKPFTAPELREWRGGQGTLELTAHSAVTYASPALKGVAEQFAQQYEALTGEKLAVKAGRGGAGDVEFALKSDKKLGAEGYAINIGNKVSVSAPETEGARWAAQSLLQMLRQSRELPKGQAVDWPEYPVRGFMLDAGRKYIPLDYLYKLVDDMAYYKMNRLHVHLNDNGFKYFYDNDWDKTQAAFRMESDKFPGLTARDGHYGKKEYRDFQKYAAERGVDIVSEIDVPAHALAFTRYMPETETKIPGNDRDHLDLDAPATYALLDTLFAEYLGGEEPVFISPRFHIGTDEYQGDSVTMEKFRAFTDRYINYTKKFGKQPLIWGSLSHAKGKTPVTSEGVEMYLWSTGYAKPLDMLEQGFDLVSIPDTHVYIVPKAGYYYVYLPVDTLYKSWAPNVIGETVIDPHHKQLRGGMFAVWNDHPNNGITVRDIHHRVMHAIPTIAAKTWSAGTTSVPAEEFAAKSPALGEAPGVNYLASYPAGTVLEMAEVKPGEKLPVSEIGYDYTVEFDIDAKTEKPGTALFSTPEATFWLSDPITGQMGYSREGHLNSFRFEPLPGEKHHVKISGTNRTVTLWVDGKLIDDMNERWVRYGDSDRKMAIVRTLVFPLEQAGEFNSRISNLKVVKD